MEYGVGYILIVSLRNDKNVPDSVRLLAPALKVLGVAVCAGGLVAGPL